MRWIVIAFSLSFASPVLAQSSDEAPGLMERGFEMFLDGLMQELEPRLEELEGLSTQMGAAMRSFLEEMGPALGALIQRVEDWSVYEPPEILPNGDIIIRRKPDAPPDPSGEEAPVDDPIEL